MVLALSAGAFGQIADLEQLSSGLVYHGNEVHAFIAPRMVQGLDDAIFPLANMMPNTVSIETRDFYSVTNAQCKKDFRWCSLAGYMMKFTEVQVFAVDYPPFKDIYIVGLDGKGHIIGVRTWE